MTHSAPRVSRAGLVPGRAEGHISSAGLFFRACLLKHLEHGASSAWGPSITRQVSLLHWAVFHSDCPWSLSSLGV